MCSEMNPMCPLSHVSIQYITAKHARAAPRPKTSVEWSYVNEILGLSRWDASLVTPVISPLIFLIRPPWKATGKSVGLTF